jgi:AcrR family transcriptional regulator
MARPANGADRRIEILKSAAAARRRGYHGASVDEIARRWNDQGESLLLLRNKEEILYACHDYCSTCCRADARRAAGTARPDEKLRRLILASHLMLDELQGTALTLDLQALAPLQRRIIAKRDRSIAASAKSSSSIDSGLFRTGDPKMIGFAIMGAVN